MTEVVDVGKGLRWYAHERVCKIIVDLALAFTE
jgi:hypothetical protein